jgi:branched-subunit amino acid ABC-type transport system permease component
VISVSVFLVQFLHGIVFGMILLLLSLGLSLIFGIGGIVNFAHGVMYMLGAYVSFVVVSVSESPLLGIGAAFVAVAVLGGVVEVLTLRPLYDRDPLDQLLATFGLVFIIEGLVINYFGTFTKTVSQPALMSGTVSFGEFFYPRYRLALLVVSAVLAAILWAFLTYTDYGVRIRAATYSSETVDALGTDTKTLFTVVFVIGAGLAGIAGAFAAPIFTVYPAMGTEMLILTFIIVIIGGLGSFRGAVVASIGIGILITMGRVFLSGFEEMTPFIAMIVILLVRPEGLFGDEVEA